ncbi:MAG: amidohydrolase family protein [Candidatus Krumholzibacteriia bacterium]
MTRVRPLIPAALSTLLLVCGVLGASAFEDRTPRVHALVGARVVARPDKVLEDATIVVRDGIVVGVGTVQPPADARVWDMRGKTIYPGLIEPYLDLTSGKSKEHEGTQAAGGDQKKEEPSGVRHPNPEVRAERRTAESLALKSERLEKLRAVGFATAHVVPSTGVFRGRSALVALRDGAPEQQILRADVAHQVAFTHGSWRNQDYRKNPTYPSSLMGAVALVRQTFLDAGWAAASAKKYETAPRGMERPHSNLALDALAAALPRGGHEPVWLLTGDVLGTLRSASLAREFELNSVLVGNGEEYQYVEDVAAAGYPVVVPVDYPEAPEFEDEDEALDVELDVLRHWDAAPSNPVRLHAAGVDFCFTSHGLKKRADFRSRIARAIERGLSEEVALAAVTTSAARMLGVDEQLGTIARGKIASFTVTDGDLFAEKTRVLEVWVDGDRYEVRDKKRDAVGRVTGLWNIVAGPEDDPTQEWTLEVKGNQWTLRGTLEDASGEVAVRGLRWQQGELLVQFGDQTLRLRPAGKKKLRGTWRRADGAESDVQASHPEPSMGGDR